LLNCQTAQTIDQAGRVDVQDEADADTVHMQICQHLRSMHWQNGWDGVDLQNDVAVYNQIRPERTLICLSG
jgi:hypothetical protein